MKQRIFNIFITLAVCGLGTFQYLTYTANKDTPVEKTEEIIEIEPEFFNKSPEEGLLEALNYYGVKHPDIVYAQAILETGYFKSDLCLNNNNLFGLYDNSNRKYYVFEHWSESVLAYVSKVQYKYKGDSSKPPNDYYRFLNKIGYAKDPHYIKKLKKIVNDKRGSEQFGSIKD